MKGLILWAQYDVFALVGFIYAEFCFYSLLYTLCAL